MWTSLPRDLVHHILVFDGRVKYRDGKYVDQIDRRDFEMLTRIPRIVIDPQRWSSGFFLPTSSVQLSGTHRMHVRVLNCPRTNRAQVVTQSFGSVVDDRVLATVSCSYRRSHLHSERTPIETVVYTYTSYPPAHDPHVLDYHSRYVSAPPHPDYLT